MTRPEEPASRPPAFPTVGDFAPAPAPEQPWSTPPAAWSPPSFSDQPPQPEVTAVTPSGAQGGRWRWLVAGLATVLMVTLVGGVFIVLGARPATPSLVAHYAPANSAVYAELRMDLPGDQRAALAEFLSHFPGFDDQATFEQKINETLENALKQADAGLSWKDDIEPWFGGQIGVSSTSMRDEVDMVPSLTVVVSVKDRTRLDELMAQWVAEAEMTQESYRDQVIWTHPSVDQSTPAAVAVTDEALIAGTNLADVKVALDAKAGDRDSLAEDEFFIRQLGTLHADRLALFYMDQQQMLSSSTAEDMGALDALGPELAACLDHFQVSTKMLAELRAAGDHMEFNTRSTYPTGEKLPPPPANRRSGLAERMPSDTVAYFEIHDAGAAINYIISGALTCFSDMGDETPGGGFDLSQIGGLLGVPVETYFDFVVDAGIGVTLSDGGGSGGLVATVDDENVARARIKQLLSFASLGGGSGTKVTEEQHGDVTVTVIAPAQGSDAIKIALADGRLYLGVDDFVTTALDQDAATSLAAAPRLQSALDSAGAEYAGLAYVDVAGIRRVIEGQFEGNGWSDYEREVKPYLAPFSQLVMVGINDNGIIAGHGFLYVE